MRDIYETFDNFSKYQHVRSQLIVKGEVKDPDISVFIPTFRRTETLKECIKSVINQMGNVNYEIIVINNDPDGINGYVKNLIEKLGNDKIYYYVNEMNIGLCGNWNRGIELSRGKYVAMIHDDDILSPWFLLSIKEAIRKNNEPGIIGVSFVDFDSTHMPEFSTPNNLKYRRISKESFFFGSYINIAGMTVKRDLIISIGGYADEFYPNEDTILIYQALLREKIINVEYVLAGYRKEINLSLSEDTMKKVIMVMEMTRRCIAKHEPFARRWMKCFDKEFLYLYVLSANTQWGMAINYREIFEACGFKDNGINKIKYIFMCVLLKIMKKFRIMQVIISC